MELIQLKYFLTAAKHENFSKAAEELYVSQPALSKMIKGLEDEIGVKLFDRVGKNIRLNECGKSAVKYCKNVFKNLDDMKTELKDISGKEENSVRLSIIASTSYLSDIVCGFKKSFPSTDISIFQKEYVNGENSADIYIYSTSDYDERTETLLLSESCSLAVSENNPLAELRQPLSVDDIKNFSDYDFFVMENRKPLSEITLKLCKSAGFVPHIALECDSHSTIFSLIEADMGVAIVPDITWQKSMEGKKVRLLKIDYPACRYIVMKTGNGYMSKAALKLKEYIMDFYGKINSMFG